MKILERIEKNKFFPVDRPDNKFWYDQDTKERYKHNLTTQPEDWSYRNKIIVYNTNSDGYRTKEFDKINWAKSVVIFGCSYVYGVGNAEDETISACLERIIGIPVINMGVAGSSPNFALHNSTILKIGYPVPKAVIHAWSSPYRCPYYNEKSVFHCGSWNRDINKMGQSWNSTTSNPAVNILMTARMAREMWSDKTNYYDFSIFSSTANYLNCDYIKQVDVARDLGHSGIKTNTLIAEKIAENIRL